MIKKTTLVVVLCAAALGAAVYYFDWKRGNEKKPAADASKPAFTIQAADVVSFTLAHPAQPDDSPIRFEKRAGVWRIVQPIETDADQSTAEGIVDQLAGARIAQTEPGSADRRKAFGLDPPQSFARFPACAMARSTRFSSATPISAAIRFTPWWTADKAYRSCRSCFRRAWANRLTICAIAPFCTSIANGSLRSA